MSNHLPECDLSYDCGLPHVQGYCHQCEMYCVCDRLNACTARVRAACIAAVNELTYEKVLKATASPKTARAQVYTLHALARSSMLEALTDRLREVQP